MNKIANIPKRLFLLICVLLLITGCTSNTPINFVEEDEEQLSENYTQRMEEFQKAIDTTIAWDYNNMEKAMSVAKWQELNKDVLFTIEIAGRHFPVMKEDSKYMSQNIKGEYDVFGTPFIREGTFPLIVSHSSSWGGKGDIDLMFTFVKQYFDKDFAKKNPLLIVNRENGDKDFYTVAALMDVDITSEEQWLGWYDKDTSLEDVSDWIKKKASVLYYDNFAQDSEFLSLYTCDLTREDARYVLVTVKVASQKAQLEEVQENIENQMKEGEN